MLRIATSPHSVPATADRIASALERRGVQLFARIDHGAGAGAAGLELADEQVLIFGDPRVGTLLMQDDPEVGYELPLRLLVWDSGGETLIGYRPPAELSSQFPGLRRTEVLERIEQLLEQLVAEAASRS